MYIIGINVTPQQEFVDKRQHLRPLTLRQLTMSMTAYDTPAHTFLAAWAETNIASSANHL